MDVRRIDGGDRVLVVRNRRDFDRTFFTTAYATLRDSDDEDALADTWSPVETIADYDPFTLDGRGGVLARHLDVRSPFGITHRIARLVDTDGDGDPEVDGDAEVGPEASALQITSGWGAADPGADRAVVTNTVIVDLDSWQRPVAGSVRNLDRLIDAVNPFVALQPVVGSDGNPVAYSRDQLRGNEFTIATWTDLDFDGRTDNRVDASVIEVRPFVRDTDFPQTPFEATLVVASRADLEPVPLVGGGAAVAFRDHGVYSDGSSFQFRFGSASYESLWIGENGIVSFLGPVAGPATLDALVSQHAAIAPLWSDDWDTSHVEVHAGYAPVQPGLRAGRPVKAFVVEWRGLRAPGWEPERRCSMRLLLYEDGYYRTDFGAMEASELGTMRLVTGYAGPGNHPSRLDVDASAHTWTFPPAGTGQERVAGQEFSASSLSDIGHLWVRWAGYPERLDAAGPVPVIVNARRTGGKITLDAAGSNIRPGATLVVDTAEAFALKRKGSSWVVRKKKRSNPGSRTVAEIWADGQTHAVRVINADGETSGVVGVP